MTTAPGFAPSTSALLAAAFIFTSAMPSEAQTASDIVVSIQRAYHSARDLKAKLKQTWQSTLYGTPKIHWGYVYGKYPDRFLMKYVKPETTQFVCDGHQVWMWDPSNQQAARIADPRALQGIRVLVGGASLNSDFAVSLERPKSAAHKYQLRLVPKQKTAQYDHIILGVRSDFIVVEAALVKKTETNRLELTGVVLNSRVSAALFAFRPPPGTRVLHAPQTAPPAPRHSPTPRKR